MNEAITRPALLRLQMSLFKRFSQQFFPIFLAIIAWLITHEVNHAVFDFTYTTPVISALFIPAGVRVVVVLCLGWRGAVGLMLGYLITAHFHHGFSTLEALPLGILSGLTPYIGYRIWLKITKQSKKLASLRLRDIFLLTALCSLFSAVGRILVLSPSNDPHGFDGFLITFTGNLLGSLVFFYILILIVRLLRFITKRIVIQ